MPKAVVATAPGKSTEVKVKDRSPPDAVASNSIEQILMIENSLFRHIVVYLQGY
jgi:hypothetical protein